MPFGIMRSKGRITIPRGVRDLLGLKEGDRVEFVLGEGRAIISPTRATENPFVKYVAVLPVFYGVDEVNAWLRKLRDE